MKSDVSMTHVCILITFNHHLIPIRGSEDGGYTVQIVTPSEAF